MPELPDLTIYLEQLAPRVLHQPVVSLQVERPFVLRTVEPPVDAAVGRRVMGLGLLGKRIVLGLEEELFIAIHLMIAGRLQWRAPGQRRPPGHTLAVFAFPPGSL